MTEIAPLRCGHCGAPVLAGAATCSFCHANLGTSSQRSQGGVGGGIDPQILELLRKNNKIAAIKRYRELYGGGLKEAKDAIDHLATLRL